MVTGNQFVGHREPMYWSQGTNLLVTGNQFIGHREPIYWSQGTNLLVTGNQFIGHREPINWSQGTNLLVTGNQFIGYGEPINWLRGTNDSDHVTKPGKRGHLLYPSTQRHSMHHCWQTDYQEAAMKSWSPWVRKGHCETRSYKQEFTRKDLRASMYCKHESHQLLLRFSSTVCRGLTMPKSNWSNWCRFCFEGAPL